MKKEELVQHLKDIRERARLNLMKLAFFSAALGGTASAAGAVPGSDSHTASGYNAGAIRVVPKAVNIAKSGSAKPIYEFENKAYEGRREVREYAGVTRYSLWDCSYKREVGNEANPVGVARTFYGSLQFNRFNAENMAIYALQQSQFADLADKFFNKGAGFEQAVKAFNEDFKKQGYLAYHNGPGAVWFLSSSRIISRFSSGKAQTTVRRCCGCNGIMPVKFIAPLMRADCAG